MPNNNNSTALIDQLNTRQIHELENLSSLTGREEFLIDDGTVTYRVSVDGILGYFASRFVGNDDDNIDITALNAASCIHIIRPGQTIPYEERIEGHFYLTLSEQNIERLYDAIMEDNEGIRYYMQTGRNDVSGLLFPDHYFINEASNKYLKICTFEIEDIVSNVYVNETFDLHLVNHVSDGHVYSKYNKVHFECLFVAGELINDSIILTCSDLSNNASLDKTVAKIYCTKSLTGTVNLWVDIDKINSVLINRSFSLSSDKAPENMSHIITGYQAKFMNHGSININQDVTNLIDTIGERVKENINAQYPIIKRLEAIETAIVKTDLDFKFNSVTFNTSSTVSKNETQLQAMLIRLIDTSLMFLIINDDGTVSVSKDGYYAISLKQGNTITIGDGPSVLEMNVYVNSAKIEDLSTQITLSEGFKMTYSTGQVTMRLNTTDKIKVTTKWSNSNVIVDNYSSLQITKYLDCVEDIDFGDLDAEMYPFVGMARVGHSRLLIGVTEGEDGEIDINLYTLPLVDVAQTDNSILKVIQDDSDLYI
ncbi:MAG: hypothetical protein PHC62_00515 [Candidatus Izemoplasmatales bacterium]|nr:hypothetical protein [Candidatus Izemoplasmatales bacterium]